MRYFVNRAIDYAATPYTRGFVAGDHALSWSFDDSTISTGPNVGKIWTTSGTHNVTVTATNTKTNKSGTDSKAIVVEPDTTMTPVAKFAIGGHGVMMKLPSGKVIVEGSGCHKIIDPSALTIANNSAPLLYGDTYRDTPNFCPTSDGVILCGGNGEGPRGLYAVKFTEASGWTSIAQLPNDIGWGYTGITGFLLPSGKTVAFGYNSSIGLYNKTYDPVADSWSATPMAGAGVHGSIYQSFAQLDDGQLAILDPARTAGDFRIFKYAEGYGAQQMTHVENYTYVDTPAVTIPSSAFATSMFAQSVTRLSGNRILLTAATSLLNSGPASAQGFIIDLTGCDIPQANVPNQGDFPHYVNPGSYTRTIDMPTPYVGYGVQINDDYVMFFGGSTSAAAGKKIFGYNVTQNLWHYHGEMPTTMEFVLAAYCKDTLERSRLLHCIGDGYNRVVVQDGDNKNIYIYDV